MLTPEELEALDTVSTFARQLRRIIFGFENANDGPQAGFDWAEAADKIHQLQRMILAQDACRNYPGCFRPLGKSTGGLPPQKEKKDA